MHYLPSKLLQNYQLMLQRIETDESQVVDIFICSMLMASLQFHWAFDKGALFDSPLLAVGWTATVLLLWNCILIVWQERYDFYTRSEKSDKYRPRRRLFIWEVAHLLFSLGLFAVSFSINLKVSTDI